MKSLFNLDNPLFRFFTRIFDIAQLNLLFLLCCIPIVTIGPAITALYYCLFKIVRKTDTSITAMFFHSFKVNLKQGIALTILWGIIICVLILDIRVCLSLDITFLNQFTDVLYVLGVVLGCIISYTFPLLAQFGNRSRTIIKYALLLAISNFGKTIYITLLNSVPFILFIFFPELFLSSLLIWIFAGFSLIAYINARMFVPIFNKFIPESQETCLCH